MPHFVIRALDKPNSLDLRLANRPLHLDHARSIGDALFVAGPLLDTAGDKPIGSLIIVEMATLADVEAFAAADPYAIAGLFASVEIIPWRRALP
jgi:uncharacterized protein